MGVQCRCNTVVEILDKKTSLKTGLHSACSHMLKISLYQKSEDNIWADILEYINIFQTQFFNFNMALFLSNFFFARIHYIKCKVVGHVEEGKKFYIDIS